MLVIKITSSSSSSELYVSY